MNWDDLRFFLALVREGTASAAARALGVKHTTVNRRIVALEEKLGSRLFDHLKDGYVMTAIGENLYPHALAMEEQALAVGRKAFGMDAELKGPIKLTAPYFAFSSLLMPKLQAFMDSYPGIDIELVGSTELADMASRQADIAIRMTAKPPEYLVGKQVCPLRHGIYGSTEYFERNQGEHKLVLWSSEQCMPQWAIDNFSGAQLALHSSDILTMVTAVKNHLGIARLPCYIADAQADLRRLDAELPPSLWNVWVLSHVDLRATARVRTFRDYLIQTINEQRDLILGTQSRYHRGG